MTREEVQLRISKIESTHGDGEKHAMEDQLFRDFCEAVRLKKYPTTGVASRVAEEVMKVRELKFHRWVE